MGASSAAEGEERDIAMDSVIGMEEAAASLLEKPVGCAVSDAVLAGMLSVPVACGDDAEASACTFAAAYGFDVASVRSGCPCCGCRAVMWGAGAVFGDVTPEDVMPEGGRSATPGDALGAVRVSSWACQACCQPGLASAIPASDAAEESVSKAGAVSGERGDSCPDATTCSCVGTCSFFARVPVAEGEATSSLVAVLPPTDEELFPSLASVVAWAGACGVCRKAFSSGVSGSFSALFFLRSSRPSSARKASALTAESELRSSPDCPSVSFEVPASSSFSVAAAVVEIAPSATLSAAEERAVPAVSGSFMVCATGASGSWTWAEMSFMPACDWRPSVKEGVVVAFSLFCRTSAASRDEAVWLVAPGSCAT